MSLKDGRASGVSADNAHGVIRPTSPQRMQAGPGPPESLAGLATAPGFSSPTPPASPNIACRRSRQASQGAQFVEADAGEDFHAAASARRRACSSSLARPRWRWHGGSAALDGMQGRGAAWTSPSPSWRSSWRRGPCPERSAATPGRSAQAAAKTPDDIARASTSSPASAAVAGAPGAAPAEMTEQASTRRRSLSIGFATWSFMPAARRLRGRPARRWRSWRIGSPAKRPSARILRVASRPSISGICMSISTASNGTLAFQHLLNARQPAVGEATGRPRCSTARRRPGGSARCPPLPADARPQPLGALHQARRRVGRGACSPCNACSTESASCLGVTGPVRKSTKGGALWSRASASTSRP